ncbi:hypothetical protein UO65_3900 [Actinokineospora spheciospongiae]|uniref:Uncharacterized protein n=1 Tax=Actinokineospora spheciospongiae TaxID=909613 RepID=W7IWI2_9PSEU|nr:hypothetical protein UO65_3900 [Actinokineospora spheciospongiae]
MPGWGVPQSVLPRVIGQGLQHRSTRLIHAGRMPRGSGCQTPVQATFSTVESGRPNKTVRRGIVRGQWNSCTNPAVHDVVRAQSSGGRR